MRTFTALAASIVFLGIYLVSIQQDKGTVPAERPTAPEIQDVYLEPDTQHSEWRAPMTRAAERITKKPFGIYITPQNSPVFPERFNGYHAGTDFEIFPGEEEIDVPVSTICTGEVVVARRVNGYGGVLIQECDISDMGTVTVLYGHLDLNSIDVPVGNTVSAGEFIANLGEGFSEQADGERKHLHLAVHKGAAIEYRGYVKREVELEAWLDPVQLLGL